MLKTVLCGTRAISARSVRICDGVPSTAQSSLNIVSGQRFLAKDISTRHAKVIDESKADANCLHKHCWPNITEIQLKGLLNPRTPPPIVKKKQQKIR